MSPEFERSAQLNVFFIIVFYGKTLNVKLCMLRSYSGFFCLPVKKYVLLIRGILNLDPQYHCIKVLSHIKMDFYGKTIIKNA